MKKYLIVVDMQKDFVTGALGTSEAVAIVNNVVNKIKSFDGDIIVTYDTHLEDYMETSEGKKLPVPHCIKGTEGWELNDSVQQALGSLEENMCIEVEKPTFGSVLLPEILMTLAKEEPFSVELIGLCTDICVVSNALLLKANFPETEIFVDASCCAGVTPATHKAALETMKMCQINVVNE